MADSWVPWRDLEPVGFGWDYVRTSRSRSVIRTLDAVGHAGVQVDMMVERRTEAVQEGDAAESRAGPGPAERPVDREGAVGFAAPAHSRFIDWHG